MRGQLLAMDPPHHRDVRKVLLNNSHKQIPVRLVPR